MSKRESYPNIDMQKTGKRIRHLIENAGYNPKMIQEYLHLSCVQPIYRWYKGMILPSVDHLFMLSGLLGVHMEDFLVKKNAMVVLGKTDGKYSSRAQKRFMEYCKKLNRLVA